MKMYALQTEMKNDRTENTELVTVALLSQREPEKIMSLLYDNHWRRSTENHTAQSEARWFVTIVDADEIPGLIWDC